MPVFDLKFRPFALLLAVTFLCVGCAPTAEGPQGDSTVEAPEESSAGDESGSAEAAPVAKSSTDSQSESGDDSEKAMEDQPDSKPSETEKSKPADSDLGNSKPALYSPEAFRNAAFEGKERVIEVCLKDNLDVNEQDTNGLTALAMASYNGHTHVVKLLLEHGAKFELSDRQGRTPLYHAASGPYPGTVQLLLDAGAKINAVDTGEGFSALMVAAAEGNIEVVKLLLAAGADKSLADIDDDTAMDFARKAGHTKIVELLQ